MSFTEKIDVLELLINLLKENETRLDSLIEKMETVEHTVTQNPGLSKTLKEYDSTSVESLSQNILVVDDDKNLANSFKLILESVGYTVDTVYTGLAALYKITKKNYDLVILDWNLPDMLGDEVAEKIEEYHNHTDILFITGYSLFKDYVEGELDEREMLMKPVEPDILLKKASKRLARVQRWIGTELKHRTQTWVAETTRD